MLLKFINCTSTCSGIKVEVVGVGWVGDCKSPEEAREKLHGADRSHSGS